MTERDRERQRRSSSSKEMDAPTLQTSSNIIEKTKVQMKSQALCVQEEVFFKRERDKPKPAEVKVKQSRRMALEVSPAASMPLHCS